MKRILLPALIFAALVSGAQTPSLQDLYKLYQAGTYDLVIEKALPLLQTDGNNADLNLIIGRAFADKGSYRDAIPYLDRTIKNDHKNSWRKAWALGYIGTCYFMSEQSDKSKESLLECYNLNATKNATQYAFRRILLFGYHDEYRNWKLLESNHFRFYFQKLPDERIEEFVSLRERTYDDINLFFKSTLPKKIDFFVWDSKDDAKRVLNANLGFADPEFGVVHCHFGQTKGHEMTHLISHYSTEISNKTEFINEGTSVYFDQTNRDRAQIVKDWIRANNTTVSVKDIWINWRSYPEELSYPLSGLFIKELIQRFGREMFLTFFKDQRYENARLVFGDRLDKLIEEFDGEINNI